MPVTVNSRYHSLPIYQVGGRLVFGQRELRQRDNAQAIEHRMTEGETLDLLAKRFLGREDLWWRIADANPGRFPLDFRAGDLVRIPLGPTVTRRPTEGQGR